LAMWFWKVFWVHLSALFDCSQKMSRTQGTKNFWASSFPNRCVSICAHELNWIDGRGSVDRLFKSTRLDACAVIVTFLYLKLTVEFLAFMSVLHKYRVLEHLIWLWLILLVDVLQQSRHHCLHEIGFIKLGYYGFRFRV
jgi:hypothetical protein